MASPLVEASAVDVLEEAVRALRERAMETFVDHWIGSVPFALGLLVFWSDMTRPRTADSSCAIESFVLALLLVWMNCWRSVFAGRVRRQLSGAEDLPWTFRRVWRLMLKQAVCGGTKLLVMPLAACAVLPLAWTAAFYRNTVVLADQEDLDLVQWIAKARKLASFEQRQSWVAILILGSLYVIAFINVAITLALLPQMVRILTGYESVFSRSGIHLVTSAMFWLVALALTWIAFDPFVQAVYCVRCFRGESVETGEDLRAALRLMKKAVEAAPAILVAAVLLAVPARAAVAPEDLDRAIRETLQAREYDWRLALSKDRHVAGVPWLVTATDRIIDRTRRSLRAVGHAIRRFMDWLRRRSNWVPEQDSAPPGALLWAIYLLIVAMLASAAFVVWRWRRTRNAKPGPLAAPGAAVSLYDENLFADELPEESWFALAEKCLRGQDFRSALRALYLANLAWLGQRQWILIHPGKTNNEYELELRRRARAFPEACSLFAANINSFERAWYGMHEVSPADTDRFRFQLQRMKAMMTLPGAAA